MQKRKRMPILVHYSCRDAETGELLEDTHGDAPDELLPGAGDWPEAIEQALLNMAPGEQRILRLAPDEAFGIPDETLFFEIPREMLQMENPEPGDIVEICPDGENSMPGTIVECTDSHALIDANHPYAGRVLEYALTRVR